MLDFLDAAQDLKVLPRSGWLLAGVAPAESVADHSFAMALLATALAGEINRAPEAHDLESPLHVEKLMRMALIHDLGESHVTDLPHRATRLIGSDVKHAAERRALVRICGGLADGEEWLSLSDEYTENASPEARLLHDCDALEMTAQAARYRRCGNQNLDDFLAIRSYSFAICADLHQRILARSLSARDP